jgi:hypothetical protein
VNKVSDYFLAALAVGAYAAFIFLVGASFVRGHSFYDPECCSEKDCAPVEEGTIQEEPAGFTVRATGEFIPRDSSKVRMSPDGKWHRCSWNGLPGERTLCIYVPGRGA